MSPVNTRQFFTIAGGSTLSSAWTANAAVIAQPRTAAALILIGIFHAFDRMQILQPNPLGVSADNWE
jgi:hypothetical protein